jgi:poly(A) polymerase
VTLRETAAGVARKLRDAGHEALFAGGCVRDRLRGEEPKDYDIATAATPEQVLGLFPRTIPVGAAFGVVLVLEHGERFEVATFRDDIGIGDGRHPVEVRFSDARADALRRDFTVNGMFEDPETGEVIDHVGGRADLAARRVRAIGDPALRFREDHLRLLRAVRFATVLDFRVEAATMAAVRDGAADLRTVSPDRVRHELTAILLSGRGGRGVGLLAEAGLLEIILPEVAALDGVEQPPAFHPEGDVLTHTRMMLDDCEGCDLVVALAVLLHDIGKAPTATVNEKGRIAFPNHAPLGAEMATAVLRRLNYPGKVVGRVERLIARHMDWKNLPQMREAKRRRFLLQEDFDLHLRLHAIDCAASHGDLAIHEYAEAQLRELEREPPPMRPLIDGHGLSDLGFVPGPAFGTILDALLDAQLEGAVATAAEARRFVIERFAPPDGHPIAGDSAR